MFSSFLGFKAFNTSDLLYKFFILETVSQGRSWFDRANAFRPHHFFPDSMRFNQSGQQFFVA